MSDTIKIKQKNNEEKEYDILFTFTLDKKNYITFTDYEHDDDNNIKCYSKEQLNNELLDIDDEHINTIITDMLNTITASTKEKYKKYNFI